MLISSFSIKNPVVTVVMMLILVLFGGLALAMLDTDEYPEVNEPYVTVIIPYPGAAPETVEREVVERLEEAFQAIPGVIDIMSTSMDSVGYITMKFDFGKDPQQATQEVRDKISEKRQDLPREMKEPSLHRYDPRQEPIIMLNVVSNQLDIAELTRVADPLVTAELRAIAGVADVKVVGGVKRELVVEVQPAALQAAGLSMTTIVDALASQNLAAPVGRVQDSLQERSIRLRGRLESPQDFEKLVVSQRGGQLVRLGDVAKVSDGAEELRNATFYNDQGAVGIYVIKGLSFSTTAVAASVMTALEKIAPKLPKGVEIKIVRNSADFVTDSINDVRNTLVEGALLTVLVVFLFLNSWRSTVITGLALPVSVLASFIAVWGLGYTLNQMSLMGLSLAIGILVDDAIVVRENIVRHMEMGKDHLTAAREGTDEIGLAVAATTFAIVVVFVPVAFMGGQAQQWLGPFALTVAASVLVSLFVSFSLDPMLSAYWADPQIEAHTKRGPVGRAIAAFNTWLDARTAGYKRLIAWSLSHRFAMVALAVVTLVAALAMPATGLIASEFIAATDDSVFSINLETQPGTSLHYTRAKMMEVVKQVRAYPEVRFVSGSIGDEDGEVDEANIVVTLLKRHERKRTQQQITAALRDELGKIGGITVSMAEQGADWKPIQVRAIGPDSRVLQQIADEIAALMRATPNCVDISFSTKGKRPELEVVIDRELAGSLGVSVSQIARALQPAFAGIDAGDWVDPAGRTRDVTVRLAPEARVNRTDLETLPLLVDGRDGKQVIIPLGQVARIQPGYGPMLIKHFNRNRTITVLANTNGKPLSEVIGPLKERIAAMSLPPGYAVRYGGADANQSDFFGRIMVSLGVAVVLMYFILVIQFGSFVEPLAIIASLPLSLIGVMLALYFTGSTVNLMSLIGVVLLMGIVAKNAILLVDFAKNAEKQGVPRRQAIIEAGAVRLRPILMTSLAIIAGMIPVAIGAGEGAEFRAPLGRAVIGGVVTSTFLTLLVIPTIYEMIAAGRDRLVAKVLGKSHAAVGRESARSGAPLGA